MSKLCFQSKHDTSLYNVFDTQCWLTLALLYSAFFVCTQTLLFAVSSKNSGVKRGQDQNCPSLPPPSKPLPHQIQHTLYRAFKGGGAITTIPHPLPHKMLLRLYRGVNWGQAKNSFTEKTKTEHEKVLSVRFTGGAVLVLSPFIFPVQSLLHPMGWFWSYPRLTPLCSVCFFW